MTKREPIMSQAGEDAVNAAIALPQNLMDDTRSFEIAKWEPKVCVGKEIRIVMEVLVYPKKDNP